MVTDHRSDTAVTQTVSHPPIALRIPRGVLVAAVLLGDTLQAMTVLELFRTHRTVGMVFG